MNAKASKIARLASVPVAVAALTFAGVGAAGAATPTEAHAGSVTTSHYSARGFDNRHDDGDGNWWNSGYDGGYGHDNGYGYGGHDGYGGGHGGGYGGGHGGGGHGGGGHGGGGGGH